MSSTTKNGNADVKPKRAPRAPGPLLKTYLVAYNVLSKLGWAYILYLSVHHLAGYSGKPTPAAKQAAASSVNYTILKNTPLALLPYYYRLKTLYSVAGKQVAFVQSFAILEVLHVLLGFVPSPLGTTAMQVASRLWLVWGIVERFPETQAHALYSTMVVAWSFAEIIRYTSYAFALLGSKPYALQWLRYSAFWILYPVGAGSEAFVMFSTVPSLSKIFTSAWNYDDYLRFGLFLYWWPGLAMMMSYMAGQRRKVLGGSRKSKAKAE